MIILKTGTLAGVLQIAGLQRVAAGQIRARCIRGHLRLNRTGRPTDNHNVRAAGCRPAACCGMPAPCMVPYRLRCTPTIRNAYDVVRVHMPQVADLQRVAAGHARTVIVMTPEGGEEEEEEAGALTLEAKQVRACMRACLCGESTQGHCITSAFVCLVQCCHATAAVPPSHVPASA